MKFKTLTLIPLLFSATAFAKVDVSPLFIQLSDAMAQVKNGEIAKSQQNLTALQQDFSKIEQHNSNAGVQVENALKAALANPNVENLEMLSKNLYAFEKEQNPVNYSTKHKTFLAQMTPLYNELQQAVEAKDMGKIKKAARNFGKTWAKYEKPVREMSLTHYGQFEKTLGLMRIAVTAENPEMSKIEDRVTELGKAMADFSQFEPK